MKQILEIEIPKEVPNMRTSVLKVPVRDKIIHNLVKGDMVDVPMVLKYWADSMDPNKKNSILNELDNYSWFVKYRYFTLDKGGNVELYVTKEYDPGKPVKK